MDSMLRVRFEVHKEEVLRLGGHDDLGVDDHRSCQDFERDGVRRHTRRSGKDILDRGLLPRAIVFNRPAEPHLGHDGVGRGAGGV